MSGIIEEKLRICKTCGEEFVQENPEDRFCQTCEKDIYAPSSEEEAGL